MSPALSFSGECTETFTDLLCTNVWILPNFHTVHAHVHRFPDIYFLCISTYLHFFLTKTTKVRRFPRDLCFLSGISLFFSFKPLIGGDQTCGKCMVLSEVMCPSNGALFGVVTKTFASIRMSFHQLSSEKQTLEVWVTGIKHPTQLYDDDFITHYKGLHILGYI